MKIITIEEVKFLALWLARKLPFEEPIPDFSTRFPNILESCLTTPFQKFSQKSLYPGLLSKSSILFYLMIKNHPFQNGNKRIAMTTLFVFLFMNDRWIKADVQELFDFAMWVALSHPRLNNEVVKAIEKFLKLFTTKLN